MASPWNSLGAALFLLSAVNCHVAWVILKQDEDEMADDENKHGKPEIVPFTFLICVVIATIQSILHYCYKIWKLKNLRAKMAITLLTIEALYLVGLASFLNPHPTYTRYQQFCLGLLPTIVVGIVAFFSLKSNEEREHESDKNLIVREIKELGKKVIPSEVVLNSMAEKDNNIKELTKNAKVSEDSIVNKDMVIEKLKIEIEGVKKELIEKEAASKNVIDPLKTKVQNMEEKEEQMKTQASEIEKLKMEIEDMRKELIKKEAASKNVIDQLKAKVQNMKEKEEQMKTQASEIENVDMKKELIEKEAASKNVIDQLKVEVQNMKEKENTSC